MKKILIKLFLILCIFSSLNAEDNEVLVKELLESAGLIHGLNNIEKKLSKKNSNIYIKKFAEIYNPIKLKEDIIENINNALEDEDIDYLLDWYSSETSIISERENENISFKQAQELITKPEEFLKDKNRVKTILKINDLLKISELDYKVTNIILLLNAKQHGTKEMSDIEKYYLSKPKELERKMRNQSIIFLLYKFRDITNEKLEVYLDFLNTKSAKIFIETFNKTFFTNINEILKQTMK